MDRKKHPQLTTLHSVATKRRAWFWRITLATLLVILIGAIFAFALLDFRMPLSAVTRWFVWLATLGITGYFLVKNRHAVIRQFTPKEAARAMESERPEVGQKIRTAFEIANDPSQDDEAYGFRDQLVADADAFLTKHNWKTLIPKPQALRWLLAFSLLAISLLGATIVWPEFGLGVKRIVFPGTSSTYTKLAWENPPEWYDQRHPPLVQINISGRPAEPKLYVKEGEQGEYQELALNPRDNSPTWDTALVGHEQNLSIYATAGDGRSETIHIKYEPIPELREAKVTLEYPEYIDRQNEVRAGGDVRALEGTKLTWTFTFNTAPADVKWEIGETVPETLESTLTCSTSTYSLKSGVRNPVLSVTDRRGRPVDSWRFEIEGLVDQLPTIELLEPAEDLNATSITEIPVRIRAEDDYGLGEVGIVLVAGEQNKWLLEKVIDVSNQRRANEMVSAMLEKIPLEITDNVRLYAYALDQKPRGGPRALSHLRSIDIRQFKIRAKIVEPKEGEGVEPKDLVPLNKIVERQREIVSQIFVLKAGGRDSISQQLYARCNAEAEKEITLAADTAALAKHWLDSC